MKHGRKWALHKMLLMSNTKQLEQAGQLQLLNSPEWINTANGEAVIHFSLPRQGVSLLRLTYR
jgi:hypothetical protein